uniref:Non-specific serine/threonine protein kinase n=1 Tax=Rhabditophanes sp. KR3021 TaxID=114890 RepID=A0AC35THI1_9BILA
MANNSKRYTEVVPTSHGTGIFQFDKDGQTALHLAQINAHAETSSLIMPNYQATQELIGVLRKNLLDAAETGTLYDKDIFFAKISSISERKVLNGESQSDEGVFMKAVKHGHLEFARDLLIFHDHSLQDAETGDTALHYAVRTGERDVIELVLDNFCFLMSCKNKLGQTPIHIASTNGYTEVVSALISHGADIFQFDKDGHTALHLAQINAHTETSNLIISNYQATQELIGVLRKNLLDAAETGTLQDKDIFFAKISSILESKVLNGENNDDEGVFMKSVKHGNLDFARDLLRFHNHSLQEASTGDTALHFAVRTGEKDIIKLVLDNFCFLMSCKNKLGQLPIHVACFDGDSEVIKTLLYFEYPKEHFDEIENFEFKLPLIDAKKETTEACPFHLDVYDSNGKTSLMMTCSFSNEPILRLLLQAGANPNLPIALTDDDILNMSSSTEMVRCIGSGALIEACRTKNLTFVKILLHYGAYDHENKALSLAVTNECEDISSLLLSKLSFPDNEHSVNKKIFQPTSHIPPAVLLNWKNCNLSNFPAEFILASVTRISPKIKTTRAAYASLTKLDLSENLLTSVPSVTLLLPSLKFLNLSNNRITSFEKIDSFQTTVLSLETLILTKNELEELPGQVFSSIHFPVLKSLNASHNKIKLLPCNIWSATTLKDLNLSNNEIDTLPSTVVLFDRHARPGISSPKKTAKQIIKNMLIPTTMDARQTSPAEEATEVNEREVELKRVNLWQNNLSLLKFDLEEEEVAVDKSELNCLSSLNLAGNKFKEMPINLSCVCPRLVKLDISNNQLTSIGPIECLPHRLRHLDVSKNNLAKAFDPLTRHHMNCFATNGMSINNNSSRNPRSRSKSVARNRRSLSVIRNLPETISKTNQPDICIHKEHKQLDCLKSLNISYNQIKNIPIFLPSLCILSTPENKNLVKSSLIFPNISTVEIAANFLDHVPSAISNLQLLTSLNLQSNTLLTKLPAELGMLDKLWSLQLKDCPIKDYTIKALLEAPNYKTVDILAHLRSKLEDSRLHNHLKLIILGDQESGKTSLLNNLMGEGSILSRRLSPNALQCYEWGMEPFRKSKTEQSFGPIIFRSWDLPGSILSRRLSPNALQCYEWGMEPFRKSKTEQSFGPIIFRSWDLPGQKELSSIHQYLLTRRAIYIVSWNLNDQEAHAFTQIQDWLVKIQARAPNCPVIIVGTHFDDILANLGKFPPNYIEYLEAKIKERFINISDSEKKGLPKVFDIFFVSNKTKFNIKSLFNILYKAAYELKIAGGKIKALEQKIPSTFIAFERIILKIRDTLINSGREPLMLLSDLKIFANEKMIEKYGKSFRNDNEFENACKFLHETGTLINFDDVSLREYVFLDVQWLFDVLSKIITMKEVIANYGIMEISVFMKLTAKLCNQLAQQRKSGEKIGSRLVGALVDLFHKFELGLTFQSKYILLPSLLPGEYEKVAGYPGTDVKLKVKFQSWDITRSLKLINESQMILESHNMTSSIISPRFKSIVSKLSLDDAKDALMSSFRKRDSESPSKPSLPVLDEGYVLNSMEDIQTFQMSVKKMNNLRITRLFAVQYVPYGFWPRLITRILDDFRISSIIGTLFHTNKTGISLQTLKMIADSKFSNAEWTLWKTGIESNAFSENIFCLKQFLAMADIKDVPYDQLTLMSKDETDTWRPFIMNDYFMIELRIPYLQFTVNVNDRIGTFETNPVVAAQLTAIVSNIIDTLLEDWYPALGTRFVHTSEGRYLINRLVPCTRCLMDIKNQPKSKQSQDDSDIHTVKQMPSKSTTMYNLPLLSSESSPKLYAFTIEECILKFHDSVIMKCPQHNMVDVRQVSPDSAFLDISKDLIINCENLRKSKLIGRGSFGFVFFGSVKLKNDFIPEAALKMLEPVDPGNNSDEATINTYKISHQMWQRDPLQHCCKAYCTIRQELSVLFHLKHKNITTLLGICVRPLTLVIELAPMGSLDSLLSTYRKNGVHLKLSVIQETVVQISKALEYLHLNHIIYKDLKCENVLVWQFPYPFTTLKEVALKLGDYGISRCSNGSGKLKGFGGTECFMAPEMIRYNGEQEYNSKIDCFSFGMFIYELLSLRLPFEGQEQFKELILEGGRPQLFENDLLNPSNYLDLMVTCWNHSSEDRPTSSEIVSIATAPEFRFILDVVVIPETSLEIFTNSISFLKTEQTSTASYDNIIDEMFGNIWINSSNSSIYSIKYNATGFLECKNFALIKTSAKVTSMCHILGAVWVADSNGIVKIFSESNFVEICSFPVNLLVKKPIQNRSIVQQMVAIPENKDLILFVLQYTIMIVSAKDGLSQPVAISQIQLTNSLFSVIIPTFSNDKKQIWTGHDSGLLYCHFLNENNQFTFSSSLSHSDMSGKDVGTIVRMYHSTLSEETCVWTNAENEPTVFLWSGK